MVGCKLPACLVILGCQAVLGHKMALQHFTFEAALQARDYVQFHRRANRYGRLPLLLSGRSWGIHSGESMIDRLDETWNGFQLDGIVTDVCRNYIGSKRYERFIFH